MQLRDAVGESDELATRLGTLTTDRDACSRRAADADAHSEQLTAQLSGAVAESAALVTQLDSVTAERDALRQQSAESLASRDTMAGQLHDAVAECDAQAARIAGMTAQTEALRAEKRHAADAEAAWIAEARRAQFDADVARRAAAEAGAHCGGAQRRAEEMEANLTVLDDEVRVSTRIITAKL